MPDFPHPPPVIGHRGAASHAPENTLAGIRKAAALGVTMIEIDSKLTADGVPVLLHDDLLDRTTNGAGPVREATLATIRTLDAGGWFADGFAGEPVPTLAEALELTASLGLSVNLEIKPCKGRERETAERSLEVAREIWPSDSRPPLVSSFARPSMETALAAAPDWPRGFLFDKRPRDFEAAVGLLKPATLNTSHKRLTGKTVSALKTTGLPLLAYTVNDPARARALFEMGVDGVFSDCPDAILAAVPNAN